MKTFSSDTFSDWPFRPIIIFNSRWSTWYLKQLESPAALVNGFETKHEPMDELPVLFHFNLVSNLHVGKVIQAAM